MLFVCDINLPYKLTCKIIIKELLSLDIRNIANCLRIHNVQPVNTVSTHEDMSFMSVYEFMQLISFVVSAISEANIEQDLKVELLFRYSDKSDF